ncbi:hypothetical protein VNPA120661_13780 [Pseudomonas aeruginosa]|nr:hypothetical protein VNPA120641_12280 [Pseudomonas aeruginosa]GLE81065.1 hypothetical protein VNPA120661_13780 [Pseudomonas aeruginosa]GLE87297.1 hypothetical protein VNPA120719_06850 [Pseudomonas aeruginosa]GLF10736.1 hypothetical protein VNPA131183_41950 [Pseudomonas aeruginosa]GLF42908.1 hypothetical protein VNPA141709_56690 [Pseudomonas aeruginosa]
MDVVLVDFDLDFVRGFENLLVSNADHVGSLGEKGPSVLAVGARTSEMAGLKFGLGLTQEQETPPKRGSWSWD